MTGLTTGHSEWLTWSVAASWVLTAIAAGRIGYAPSRGGMRRRIGFVAAVGAIGAMLSATLMTASALAWPSGGPSRLLLQAALLLAPFAAAAVRTAPRLWQAARAAAPGGAEPPDAPDRRRAADPAAVVPVQAAALGACLNACIGGASNGAVGWFAAAVSIPLLTLAVWLLWRRQRTKRRRMGRIHWTRPSFAASAARGSLALLLATAIAVIWLRGSGDGRLPDFPGKTHVVSLWRSGDTD